MMVYIEPWPEEFEVLPKSVLVVTISFTHLEPMGIVAGPDFLTLWLWKSCTAKVSLDGKEQTPRSLSMPWPI